MEYSGSEPLINIGIATQGQPVFEKHDGYTLLKNQRIGLEFHWEQIIESRLPGEVWENDDPVFRLINRVPLETYLECVIGSEMNPEAPLEFLKAHAVISRCWAIGKISGSHNIEAIGKTDTPKRIINWEDTADHNGFDVCADDHCQRYQGLQKIDNRTKESIRATSGLVLVSSEGGIVDTRFSKCCGGRTEVFSSCWQSRNEPCLESFEDPWCNLTDLEPQKKELILKSILKEYDLINEGGYKWSTSITEKDIRKNLNGKFGRDIGRIEDIKVIERGPSGRATLLRLKGSEGELEIGKELMIRRLLASTHLYSSRINITRESCHPDTYHIDGRGWGHGVGLCQIGAARMALEGCNFREILSFYYPGSILKSII